ncbi:MAG: hypothetical protein Fur0018_05810 [Anaerolineales bacterium]
MYKLVIIIPPQQDAAALHEQWPHFLHVAESMPGLVREVTVRPHAHIYGAYWVEMIHELYFDTLKTLEAALLSPAGQAAGGLLQEICHHRVTLFIAEHYENELVHIQAAQNAPVTGNE